MQQAEDVQLVRALADNPASGVDYERKFKGLEEQQLRRKDNHDAALHQYQQQLAAFSEQLEEEVLVCSRDVRDALSQNDELISKLTAQMHDDAFLLALELKGVKMLRTEAEDVIAQRRQIVGQFEGKLEEIELTRSRTIESNLTELTKELTAIAHKLRGDIEQIVEDEAYELNSVMTSNRQTYAELTTIMKKQVISKRTSLVAEWEACMQQWRLLMHNRELQQVLTEFASIDVVDPPARNAYLQDVQTARDQHFRGRKDLMFQLESMNPSSITSSEVDSISKEFEAMNAAELSNIREWYDGLSAIRERVHDSMTSTREALRKRLHYYGALKLEPPLEEHAVRMQTFLNDDQLADLYRRAGGLKPELSQLLQELRDSDIAYKTVLDAARARTRMICAGFELPVVLERQGKSSVRDVLRANNDKIRGTPKAEVLPLLPLLKKQIADLAEVQDIDDYCKELLLECMTDVETVITTAEDLRTAGDDGTRTAAHTIAGRSKAPSLTGTTRTHTKRSRRGSNTSFTHTTMPEDDERLVVDMVTLRTTQKKLGMILLVGDLPDTVKGELLAIAGALEQQQECNVVVDEAVATSCDPIMRTVSQQQKQIVEAVILSLERHAEYWAAVGTRVCAFYARLAIVKEDHDAKTTALDDENHDMMAILEFNFEQEVQRLEQLLAACCKQLSYAINDEQLELEFDRALRLLEQLEHYYHHYHSVACFAADVQPVASTKAAHQLLKILCDTFHLLPSMEHDLICRYRHTRSEAKRLNRSFLPEDEPGMENSMTTRDGGDLADSAAPAVTEQEPATRSETEQESKVEDAEEYQALNPPVETMNAWLAVDESVYVDAALQESWSSLQTDAVFPISMDEQTNTGTVAAAFGVLVPFTDISAQLLALNRTHEGGASDEEKAAETFETFYSMLREETLAAYPDFASSGCSWWQPEFKLLSEEEMQEANPSELMSVVADSFLVLHESELQDLSITEQRAYTAAKSFAQAIQDGLLSEQPTTEEERLARYLRSPSGSDGTSFVPQLTPAADDIVCMLSRAASCFLVHAQQISTQHINDAVAFSEQWKQKLTELLEEKIRTHWPRRGEIETTIMQQREGELIAHHQLLARHQQLVRSKANALEERFLQLLLVARTQCDDFVTNLATVRNKLSEQTTLAGVQGLELRGKKLHDEFQAVCESNVATLSTYLVEEPERLKASNREILRACKSFSEGGNYSERELETVHAALQALDGQIQEVALARQQHITDLQEQQQQTAAGMNDFWVQSKQVAQDLALSEGLGQKYGAPRRTAQERIRTEVTRDESAAGQIDEWLAALEFECSEVEWYMRIYEDAEPSTNRGGGSPYKSHKSAAWGQAESLHEVVRNKLLQIRAGVRHRVQYLAIEEGIVRAAIGDGSVVWIAATSEPPPTPHPFDAESKPFAQAVQEAQEECKTNTVQLYKAEGKLDLITRDGQTALPDALLRWLGDISGKLLGPNGHKARSSERLWTQVARLDRLWGREFMTKGITIPVVCFRNLFLASTTAFRANAGGLEKQFDKSLKAWELGRQKHERILRPQLSTPEGADELAALCEAEAERSAELINAIIAFRRDLFAGQFQQTQQFLIDVHNLATGLLQLLDSTVSAEPRQQPQQQQQQQDQQHLQQTLEGVEAPAPRKSYKRLRKVQRLKQEALKARESSSASGSRTAPAASSSTSDVAFERKRTWASLEMSAFVTALQEADVACQSNAEVSRQQEGNSGPTESAIATASSTPHSSFEQQYAAWMTELAESSPLVSVVTPAHRTLFRERDAACSTLLEQVLAFAQRTRARCAELLQQEHNWQMRWARQLDLLKSNSSV